MSITSHWTKAPTPQPTQTNTHPLLANKQLVAAVVLRGASWPLLLLMTYTLSGACNHFLTLIMHEVAHNLAFKVLHRRWHIIVKPTRA